MDNLGNLRKSETIEKSPMQSLSLLQGSNFQKCNTGNMITKYGARIVNNLDYKINQAPKTDRETIMESFDSVNT